MGSLMPQSSPPADRRPPSDELACPPELSDALYLAEVLHLQDLAAEGELDRALSAKAGALGIPASRPPRAAEQLNASSAGSAFTVATSYARTASTGSDSSDSTALTSRLSTLDVTASESVGLGKTLTRSSSLNFSRYENYLGHVEPNLSQPRFLKGLPPIPEPAPSLFSISTRKSIQSIKRGIQSKLKWKKKNHGERFSGLPLLVHHTEESPDSGPAPVVKTHASLSSCICCREDFSKNLSLQTLPCGHTYCSKCLGVMINQSSTDESKMPPRCCTQPIPGPIIRAVLTAHEQHVFLKAVHQFSTPWEQRLFCPSPDCGEFIPPRKIDPRHPFSAECRKCRAWVCVMCKRDAHPLGKDCPEDEELDAVLRMGEKSGWRRCYKCRNLVELAQGCTHMTCRCKAQFCYICGAVWDRTVGCPNVCNGEEELERRRVEERARIAELEAGKLAREAAAAAEEERRLEAEARSRGCPDFQALTAQQAEEMRRFHEFGQRARSAVAERHAQQRAAQADRFVDQQAKMRERHARTTQHLDDRQLAAEMELRATLESTERSVKIRLRHMEAYCDALGRSAADGSGMPARRVTERDLRELGQQYNLRDDMERLHRAKINVMRDRQAKSMEELLARQEAEMQRLVARRDEEVEDLHAGFAAELDDLARLVAERRDRLQRRWELAIEILRHEREQATGLKHGAVETPEWPPTAAEMESAADRTLSVVLE